MHLNLYDFKQVLDQYNIIFYFSGPISQVLMAEIGDILKQKMITGDTDKSSVSRVFSILVEQVQNIIHYSDEKYPVDNSVYLVDQLSVGIVAVGTDDDYTAVISGNRIENSKTEELKAKLENLRRMNRNQLKDHYREQRRLKPNYSSKGAGLGFIEMARRSSKPLEYDIKKIDAQYSFYTIKALV